MKRFSITILLFVFAVSSYCQLADHIVIAEVYGGGGNSGSHWTNDYIILYNPTASSVDVSSWSVQYASATGSSWQVTALLGSIGSNSYYAIQEAQGTGGSSALPFTPNVIGTIAMSATSGKVALVNNQTALSGGNPLPNANIIDFIGYGSTASAFEGTAPAPTLSNTSSARRKDNNGNSTYGINGSGWDTDDNSNDFYEEADIINNVPLPVELSSFSAVVLDNGVKLNWRTETEVNNYGFEVQRAHTSTPLSVTEWNALGFVEGSGNSNSPKEYSFIDKNVSGGKYSYRLKQIDTDGQFEYSNVIEVNFGSPDEFILFQNYPNPFNPATKIKFHIPDVIASETKQSRLVTLKVYDVLGNEIATLVNEEKPPGVYEVEFSSHSGEVWNQPSGVYFYKLETNGLVQSKKMILLK